MRQPEPRTPAPGAFTPPTRARGLAWAPSGPEAWRLRHNGRTVAWCRYRRGLWRAVGAPDEQLGTAVTLETAQALAEAWAVRGAP